MPKQTTQDTWAGPSGLPPDAADAVPLTTRELRTRAERPDAPPLEMLFPRDATPPGQRIVVWDPQASWPAFSLRPLAQAAHGAIGEIVLVQEQRPDAPVARLRSTLVPTPSGQTLGVIQVEAAPGDDLALPVALSLLAQADRAVVLAGSGQDKELVRRIGERVRPDSWQGPPLLLVSPADKPSRADRLRRSHWPRGLRIHVLELFQSGAPDWSQQLVAMVCGHGEARTPVPAPAAPVPPPPASPPALPSPMPTTPLPAHDTHNAHDLPTPSPASAVPRGAVSTDLDETRVARMLGVLAMGPGVVGAALVSVDSAELLAIDAATETAQAEIGRAARRTCAMWRAQQAVGDDAAEAPAAELMWTAAGRHHLALPLPRQPGLLLLACVDRDFGDLSAARWQAAVARNQWR